MFAILQKYAESPRTAQAPCPAPLETVLSCVPDALSVFEARELAALRRVSRTMQRTVEAAPEWRSLFAAAIEVPYARLPFERPVPHAMDSGPHGTRVNYFLMYQALSELRHRYGLLELISKTEPPAPSENPPNTEARIGVDDIERLRISEALSTLRISEVSSSHRAVILRDYQQRLARTCPIDGRDALTRWTSRLERDALITHLGLTQLHLMGLDESVLPGTIACHVGLGAVGCSAVLGVAVAALRAQGINVSGLAVGVVFMAFIAAGSPVLVGAMYQQNEGKHCLALEHLLLHSLSDHDCRGCGEDPWRPTSASYAAVAGAGEP